ncbi:MAG: folate-binding protein [[Pasteurella] aerogenes]|nr:folate-binding protein [[Pasteurella] aerogenes]
MCEIIRLEQFQLIELIGVDAEKFLQGQLTCDVTALSIGATTLAGNCDPKGKLSSIFRLLRMGEQHFGLIIRKALLPIALDQLKKYAVFSKVEFSLPEAEILGVLGERPRISAQYVLSFAPNAHLLINPKDKGQATQSEKVWERWQIQQGYPILSAPAQFEFLPQALNLQGIEQAISFQKGCYMGQESVARAKYRGANKRAMLSFSAQTEHSVETLSEIEMELENGWRKTGTVLSAVNLDGTLWLQVVLNKQTQTKRFRLPSGEVLQPLPLPYSLED